MERAVGPKSDPVPSLALEKPAGVGEPSVGEVIVQNWCALGVLSRRLQKNPSRQVPAAALDLGNDRRARA